MIKVIGGSLYQWDTGRKVSVQKRDGVSIAQVHFSHSGMQNALVTVPQEEAGEVTAEIPNILLQSAQNLTVYAVVVDSDERKTIIDRTFSVVSRPRPEDYVYTETEVLNFDQIEKRIKKIEELTAGGLPGGGTVSVEVASTTTGEPGTDAQVTNSGTEQNVKLNFVIPKGDTGETGPQGPKGEKGDTGPAGKDGAQGEKGEKGDTGPQGPAGPKGDTGEAGPPGAQGPAGEKGSTGATPNIQIGTVQTLEPGQDATASMTGTAENPLLNLGIPRGADVTGGSSGGISDYSELQNKPKLNNVELVGNKTLSEIGAKPSDFVIHVTTEDGFDYQSDKTYEEIKAEYESGSGSDMVCIVTDNLNLGGDITLPFAGIQFEKFSFGVYFGLTSIAVYVSKEDGMDRVATEINQIMASESQLGGVKVATLTDNDSDYTVEVKIDSITGRLYVPAHQNT